MAIFEFVLKLLKDKGLVKGERIGVDASTMEANAAMRNIEKRIDGESYREMLMRLAKEDGIETPTAEDLIKTDKKRKNKKLSNKAAQRYILQFTLVSIRCSTYLTCN